MAERKNKYSYTADTVFAALKNLCNKHRFNIINLDESIKRIVISKSISSFSYGENIEIIVIPQENDNSLIYIKSKPKLFFNIPAYFAAESNIRNILQLLDEELKVI